MGLKSATGVQLARAELYAQDSSGRRIPPARRGDHEMRVNETRSYTDPTPLEDVTIDDRLDLLNTDERAVFELQAQRWIETRTVTVAVHELEQYLAAGWTLVRGTMVARDFPAHYTYMQIAERLGITARQVHSRVVSARRKLRGVR